MRNAFYHLASEVESSIRLLVKYSSGRWQDTSHLASPAICTQKIEPQFGCFYFYFMIVNQMAHMISTSAFSMFLSSLEMNPFMILPAFGNALLY
jgi:hypothetical protein